MFLAFHRFLNERPSELSACAHSSNTRAIMGLVSQETGEEEVL
jgi:hypothetical protein